MLPWIGYSFLIPLSSWNFLCVMGFIISYLTHRLEADAPQSMMLHFFFSSPDLCTESSPEGEGTWLSDI